MRVLTFTALGLLSIASAYSAEQQGDTLETRKVAAEKYAVVANAQKMLDDTFVALSQKIPEEERAPFLELSKKHVRTKALESLMVAAMIKNFTTQELEALAAFYGSPEGQSVLAKFPTYMADILPLVQAEVGRAVLEMRKELEEMKTKAARGA